MPTLGFADLQVYQLAEKLADQIWRVVRRWDAFARDTVGKQLVRAADSIGANIAEGCGRGTYRDNRRFVTMARGSLYETRHWLRRAFRRDLLTAKQVSEMQPIIDALPRRLNAYLKSIGKPAPGPKKPPTNGRRTNDQ
jgi:four helix bundle protein